MVVEIQALDKLISRLYRSTRDINIGDFRDWSLQELRELIPFDACIWSTGHLSTRTFHTHSSFGLPDHFQELLLESLPINPISKALFSHPGEPIDMSEVVDDKVFYSSDIYTNVFKPSGIERVLSSIHIEPRSGIYTLLSLYRSNRENRFTEEEKQHHKRALYHLINAASMAGLASLEEHPGSGLKNNEINCHAICDQYGVYHAVEESFLDLIEETYPEHNQQLLPFDIHQYQINDMAPSLIVSTHSMGDLIRVSIRPSKPFDQLSNREQEVVEGVTNGLSFKQIAKRLGLSPSTISNHLYRVYQKLNINNRSELADLMREGIKEI